MSTFDRYLGLLAQPRTPPTLESLAALVRAQLRRGPFENISKVFLKKSGASFIPSLDEHLDSIEGHNFGGRPQWNFYC